MMNALANERQLSTETADCLRALAQVAPDEETGARLMALAHRHEERARKEHVTWFEQRVTTVMQSLAARHALARRDHDRYSVEWMAHNRAAEAISEWLQRKGKV